METSLSVRSKVENILKIGSYSPFPVSQSVHRKPFEIFLWPFSRSPEAVRNFSLAVQPFTASRSKFFFGRSAVHGNRFKRLGHPFFIRSEAVRFAVERISVSVRFPVRGHILQNCKK